MGTKTNRDVQLRAYRSTDAAALWACKERFERELGGLGGDEKSRTYDRKLTPEYRRRYIEWVERCVEREPGCLVVADVRTVGDDTDVEAGTDEAERFAGYVFVLPEDCALIWDAAVLNELYVRGALRGTGVADALMERALSHAREQHLPLDRIVLDVDPGNDRARSFYRRQGFSRWGEMVARDL